MHGFSPFFDLKERYMEMATAKTAPAMDTTITNQIPEKKPVVPTAKVSVYIPMTEEGDGAKVDQNEYVTINGKTTKIPRGQYVQVSVPVFIQLRNRYPNL